jgi:TetR/AcrR family transcriptional regulator
MIAPMPARTPLDHRLPSRRAPGFAARRAIIREQAAALFAAQGYQRASLVGLARSLGVTANGITHYYFSKEDLLHAILEAHLLALLAAVEQADDETLAPRPRLEALAVAYLAFVAGPGANGHSLLREAARFLPAARALDLRTRERWLYALFREALAAAAPKTAAALLAPLTFSLFAMLNEASRWQRPEGASAEGALDPAAYAAFAVRLTLPPRDKTLGAAPPREKDSGGSAPRPA